MIGQKFQNTKSPCNDVYIHLYTVKTQIRVLVENGSVIPVGLDLGVRNEKRYVFGNPSPYQLAVMVRPNSYLTHETAAFLNQLIKRQPHLIYVNSEQPRKIQSGDELEQENIDNAFRAKQRVSNSKLSYGGRLIRLLTGMWTNRLGVIDIRDENRRALKCTDIERTLIDLTVRPVYAGGPRAVLRAYKNAIGKFTLEQLTVYLGKLGYKYPYHQAIAMYLKLTRKFSPSDLLPFKQLGLAHDFYLCHGMNQTKYDKEWRIHYPSDLG